MRDIPDDFKFDSFRPVQAQYRYIFNLKARPGDRKRIKLKIRIKSAIVGFIFFIIFIT